MLKDRVGKAMKSGIHVDSTLGIGSVPGGIVNVAKNEKVNLIIAGTRGRSGLKRLLLGSVASGIVNYAHCSVLVVK